MLVADPLLPVSLLRPPAIDATVYADGPVVVPFEPEKLVTTDGGLADSASSSSGDGAGAGAGASGRGTEPAAGPETRAWFSAVPAKGSTALTDGEDGPAAGDETKEDTSSEPVNYEVDGLWESLDWLAGYVDEHGPFDGVMGFSQGACMAALLALVRDIDGTWGWLMRCMCSTEISRTRMSLIPLFSAPS